LGIMSFTPLSTRFPKITLDISEGINYLRNIGGNSPEGEEKMRLYEGFPSAEQIEALTQFAAIHGRNWKSVLRDAWMDGDYQGFENSHLLQQVRNTFGPSFL